MNEKMANASDLFSLWGTVFIFILAMLLVGVRIFSFTPYAVVSGSMSPSIPKGSLVYVKETSLKDIMIGVPITYVVDETHLLATHRVVEIDYENQLITTKGDANEKNDSVKVLYLNVQGVVRYHIPVLGYVSQFVHSVKGMTLLVILMSIMIIRSILDKVKETNAIKSKQTYKGDLKWQTNTITENASGS